MSTYNFPPDHEGAIRDRLITNIKIVAAFTVRLILLISSITFAYSKAWPEASYCLALVAVFHLGYLRLQYHLNEK